MLVRGKLGDTLAAWASIRSYGDRHPDERIWVAVRKNYAFLFAEEPGVRLIPFASSLELFARLLRLRLGGKLDKLAVIWGFGKQIPRIARLSGAPLKAYLDNRFGPVFNAIAPAQPNDYISDASWRVTRLLDPDLPRPLALSIPSLAARRRASTPNAICIVPVADEARRTMGRQTLDELIATARQRFPGAPLQLLGNPQDKALQPLIAAGLPADVELKPFPELAQLVDALCHCRHLLTTDTGVYHLAAAMGVPATVFFGPTQPGKTVMPEQPEIIRMRVERLGNAHCEVKDCQQPYCLEQAVRRWGGKTTAGSQPLLKGCLLESE
jgi:ADP-heptose:LPS heptosyltransferase